MPEIQHQNVSGSFHSLDGLLSKSGEETSEEMLQFLVKQLQDQIALKECEIKKLKEANLTMESEHKEALSKVDLHTKTVESRNKELTERNEELYQRLKCTEEAKIESEIRAQKNLDEKREIRTLLEEKDRRLADLESKLSAKSKDLSELCEKWSMEQSEWKQFQKDLLTTVRVANDFKQDTLDECKKLQNERLMLEERLQSLDSELQKVKSENKKLQVALRSAAVAAASSNNSVSNSNPVTDQTISYPVVSNTTPVPPTNSSLNKPTASSLSTTESLGSTSTSKTSMKSPSKSPLLQRIQSCEPIGSSTGGRSTMARSSSNQISVRSLIESIESSQKQKQPQSSTSTSPIVQSPTTGSAPLCARSTSVPLGSVASHEALIIQRHLRQAVLDSSNGNNAKMSTVSSLTSERTATATAVVAPTILKDSMGKTTNTIDKSNTTTSLMSDILNNRTPRSSLR